MKKLFVLIFLLFQTSLSLAYQDADSPVYVKSIREYPEVSEFNNLWGISHRNNGNIIVTDRLNSNYHEFLPDGTPLNLKGEMGWGKNEYYRVFDYDEDLDGNIYISLR